LTERARREICRRVGEELDTVAETAGAFGVGWACAHLAVIDDGDTLIAADDRLDDVAKIRVDEHTFEHADASRRTRMATTFGDIDRARPFQVVPGRSRSCATGSANSPTSGSRGSRSRRSTRSVATPAPSAKSCPTPHW
jgi:hypothetical protein